MDIVQGRIAGRPCGTIGNKAGQVLVGTGDFETWDDPPFMIDTYLLPLQ